MFKMKKLKTIRLKMDSSLKVQQSKLSNCLIIRQHEEKKNNIIKVYIKNILNQVFYTKLNYKKTFK